MGLGEAASLRRGQELLFLGSAAAHRKDVPCLTLHVIPTMLLDLPDNNVIEIHILRYSTPRYAVLQHECERAAIHKS